MQFRFDANQEYQLHAIEAVTDLLKGQPPIHLVQTARPILREMGNSNPFIARQPFPCHT